MFKELLPILRHRAVLFTVTHLETDELRVNVMPQKLKDSDNDALTTPLSLTGPAEQLDAELAATLVGFVGSHLQLANTLTKAQAEMDAAAKAAQAEARNKAKTATKGKTQPSPQHAEPTAGASKSVESIRPVSTSMELFEGDNVDDDDAEEDEILAEIGSEPSCADA